MTRGNVYLSPRTPRLASILSRRTVMNNADERIERLVLYHRPMGKSKKNTAGGRHEEKDLQHFGSVTVAKDAVIPPEPQQIY